MGSFNAVSAAYSKVGAFTGAEVITIPGTPQVGDWVVCHYIMDSGGTGRSIGTAAMNVSGDMYELTISKRNTAGTSDVIFMRAYALPWATGDTTVTVSGDAGATTNHLGWVSLWRGFYTGPGLHVSNWANDVAVAGVMTAPDITLPADASGGSTIRLYASFSAGTAHSNPSEGTLHWAAKVGNSAGGASSVDNVGAGGGGTATMDCSGATEEYISLSFSLPNAPSGGGGGGALPLVGGGLTG